MNRAEITEGLKEVYCRLYAFTNHRKTIEACLKLLENENALLDRVLEIIDRLAKKEIRGSIDKEVGYDRAIDDFRKAVLALKGGEQE